MLHEACDRGLRAEERAADVDREYLVVNRDVQIHDHVRRALDPGVGMKQVEPAEVVDRRSDARGGTLRLADVRADPDCAVAEPLSQLAGSTLVDVGCDDATALGR